MIGYGNSMFLATHGILARSASGGGVDPDAQAFITAAAITDPTQQAAINTLVVDLKGYGVWSKMQAIYPFVGGTASTHKFNLKNPLDTDAAFRIFWSGGVTHSSNGVQFGGVNGYGDTKFIPSSALTLNSSHISFYSRTTSTGDSGIDDFGTYIGVNQAMRMMIKIQTTTDSLVDMNSVSQRIIGTVTTPSGLFLANRQNSTSLKYTRNTTSLGTNTNANTGTLPTTVMGLGCLYNNSTGSFTNFSARQCAFASIGDGLTDTEAANFYTAVQAFQTTLGRQVGTPIPYTSFPLDTYTGAEAAYSLRRLRTAYTGNLIRVRRSSDNTEMDFGYNTNNVLDTASLLTFCGAGNGFVTTWYDQSGNAKNATQTTAANQPIIVTSGTVELNNGMPNLNFNQDFLSIGTQVNLTGQHYMVYVGNSTNVEQSTSAGMIYYNANNDPSIRIGAGDNGRGILSYYNGAYQVNAETDVQLYSIITHAMTGSFTSTFYRNATQVATGSAAGALGNVTSFFIGTYSGASDTRNGNCQELIVWASDQSTNRTGITNNINGFYSAY